MKRNFLYQITAASRTPDQGATAPRSPFSLSSTEFVEPPPSEQNSWVRHWLKCIAIFVSTFWFVLSTAGDEADGSELVLPDRMKWGVDYRMVVKRILNVRVYETAVPSQSVCALRQAVSRLTYYEGVCVQQLGVALRYCTVWVTLCCVHMFAWRTIHTTWCININS